MNVITFFFDWRNKPREAVFDKDAEGIQVNIKDKEFKEMFMEHLTFKWNDMEMTYDRMHSLDEGLDQTFQIIYDAVIRVAGEPIFIRRPNE